MLVNEPIGPPTRKQALNEQLIDDTEADTSGDAALNAASGARSDAPASHHHEARDLPR